MTYQTIRKCQVLVVGGGPVGMGLAIDLGLRGIQCIVVEPHQAPQPIPKGQNLTQRTMEHFHFWGAEQKLRAERTIPKEYGIGGMTIYGTLLGRYTHDWLQRELVRPFYHTDNERLPQYATEKVLRQRAAEIPAITTLYGYRAKKLSQNEESVLTEIFEAGTSKKITVTSDYVVGCDGSRSTVREQAGLSQTKSDHDRRMVLLVFRSRTLHELLKRYPGKSFYSVLNPALEGYWQFFGRVDLGTTWFFHAPVPLGATADNFDFHRYLCEAVGEEIDTDFEHIGFWDLRVALADRYRSGRIFIAGDAAHSHPPYGGYGINTGLEDAVNLAWKLEGAIRGWGGHRLLDSYDEERRPVFASTAKDFIEKSIEVDRQFVANYNPAADKELFERKWSERQSGAVSEVNIFEPHYEGSSIVLGPDSATCSAIGKHSFHARAGHHLAPYRLPNGRNVFDELGAGFTLLAFDSDHGVADAYSRQAKALGIPLTILPISDPNFPEHYGATNVLVRPDQFVAYSSQGDDADPADIIKRAVGATGISFHPPRPRE